MTAAIASKSACGIFCLPFRTVRCNELNTGPRPELNTWQGKTNTQTEWPLPLPTL